MCWRITRPARVGGKRITSRRKANTETCDVYIYVLDSDGGDGDDDDGDGDSTMTEQIVNKEHTTQQQQKTSKTKHTKTL